MSERVLVELRQVNNMSAISWRQYFLIIINDYHVSFVLEKAVHMKICYFTGTHIPT